MTPRWKEKIREAYENVRRTNFFLKRKSDAFLTSLLRVDLMPLFVKHRNRLNRAGLRCQEDRFGIRAVLVNDVGLIITIKLKNTGSDRHARRSTNTGIAVNDNTGDLERLLCIRHIIFEIVREKRKLVNS